MPGTYFPGWRTVAQTFHFGEIGAHMLDERIVALERDQKLATLCLFYGPVPIQAILHILRKICPK